MANTKNTSDVTLALIYFFFMYGISNVIGLAILQLGVLYLFNFDAMSLNIWPMTTTVIEVLLATYIASRVIKEKFIITNPLKIALLSAVAFLLFFSSLWLYGYIMNGNLALVPLDLPLLFVQLRGVQVLSIFFFSWLFLKSK